MASRQRASTERTGRPPLRVNLLGPELLTVGGRPARAGGPGQRALLIRLALAEGHMVTTDRLVEDLWGERASETIVSTLQGYVSRLRAVLGDPARLARSGPGYVLEVAPEEVDAREFEQLLADGRRRLDDDPERAAEVLAGALDLWRGPALAEVREYEWGATAAARLDGLRLLATELRFDALLASGHHEAAAVDLQQAVAAHPLHERFVAQLMVALYRSGRQSEALREYDAARRRLVDELGLDPSPELARHEAAILAHERWLAAPRATSRRATTVEPAPARTDSIPRPRTVTVGPLPPAVLLHADRPFVGRERELTALGAAWSAAADGGDRRLVLLEGEPGIGKSRLAAVFAARAHAQGAMVLFGRATPDSIIPFEPLVEALRGALRPLPPEVRERFVAARPALRALVPLLGDVAPAVPAETHDDPATDRYLLFEAVAEVVSTTSQAVPVLLLVDDLQWADAPTAHCLAHLLRHELPARFLVVATLRTYPRVGNVAVDSLLDQLGAAGALTRLPVGGLDAGDVATLLDANGVDASAARVRSISEATHGNAFFVSEIAEHADEGSLPANIRDAFAPRMARLSEPATRLLRTAAVAGALTPATVLQTATGLTDDEVLDALDELLDRGFLVEEDDGAAAGDVASGSTTSIGFRHALVQQVVDDQLVDVRRRAIHARLAAAFAHQPGGTLRHAHHAVEAGDLVGAAELAEAVVAAGREALAVFAPEDALTWAGHALARGPQVPPEHRCAALLLASDAHRALGDRAAARAAAGDAATLARELDDPFWLAAAAEAVALARAGVGFDFGVDDSALDALLREALGRLPADDVDRRSRLLAASVSSAAASGDLYALRGLSAEAVALAERHGQHALVATTHLAARMSVWRVDMLEQRLRSDVAAYEAAVASGRLHLQLNAVLYLVSDLFEAGRVEESGQWFERLRELAARVHQPVYDAFVDFFDARTALLEGRYEDATKLADRALTIGGQSHGVNAEQAWAGVMFVRAWDEGWLASIAEVIERASAGAPKLGIWRIAHAASTLAAGDAAEAVTVLDDLLGEGRLDHPRDSLWFAAVGLLIELARSTGAAGHARTLHDELAPFTGRMTITGLGRVALGPVDRFLGVAAMTAGELDAANGYLASAVDQARRAGAAPHVARALHDRSLVLARRAGPDDAETAAALAGHAAAIADSLGMVPGPLGATRA